MPAVPMPQRLSSLGGSYHEFSSKPEVMKEKKALETLGVECRLEQIRYPGSMKQHWKLFSSGYITPKLTIQPNYPGYRSFPFVEMTSVRKGRMVDGFLVEYRSGYRDVDDTCGPSYEIYWTKERRDLNLPEARKAANILASLLKSSPIRWKIMLMISGSKSTKTYWVMAVEKY